MKALSLLNRITVDPRIMIGKPIIKGTRLPVEIIVEKVAYGASFREILEDYPFLTENDIKAALLYSARRLSLEETYALQ